MKLIKIYTDLPETIPSWLKPSLTETGMRIENDFDPFEIVMDWMVKFNLIEVYENDTLIEKIEQI